MNIDHNDISAACLLRGCYAPDAMSRPLYTLIHWSLIITLCGRYECFLHFTDAEAEAQRGQWCVQDHRLPKEPACMTSRTWLLLTALLQYLSQCPFLLSERGQKFKGQKKQISLIFIKRQCNIGALPWSVSSIVITYYLFHLDQVI